MLDTLDLDLRRSHKYVDTCSDLDDWENIGKLDVLSQGEWDDRVVLFVETRLDTLVTRREVRNAIEQCFEIRSCHCSYDCCGCRLVYANAQQVKSNLWRVELTTSQNF